MAVKPFTTVKKELRKGLVSVIIPCFNMETRIHRLFDSLLTQTYKKLQIIVVNDGSTDESEKVILHYKPIFLAEGFLFEYIYQKNAGLGAAINTGLKYIQGEYFCWPDADDTLTIDSIELKVNFLKENDDFGFVRSEAYIFNENNLAQPISYITFKSINRFKTINLVEDYIWEKNIIFCPGCHLIKTQLYQTVNPLMEIYPGRRGQNYQLLLPMLCFYKYGYIDRPLYNYVIYESSMSRGDDSLHKILARYNGLEDIMIETFKTIPISDELRTDYIYQTRQKYFIARAKAAYNYGDKQLFEDNFSQIDNKYMTSALLIANKRITRPILLRLHTFYYLATTKLRNSQLKYILKKIKFKWQFYKYDYSQN